MLTEKQREQNRERVRRWVRNNPERHKENLRRWRAANREKLRAAEKRYEESHHDQTLAKWRRAYEKNREKKMAAMRARYHANKEKFHDYYVRNKKEISRKAREKRLANIEFYRKREKENHVKQAPFLTARARKRKAELVARFGGKCTDCGFVGPPCVYHFDHIDPKTKVACVSVLMKRTRALEAEVVKCRLLCANCHAIRTWGKD